MPFVCASVEMLFSFINKCHFPFYYYNGGDGEKVGSGTNYCLKEFGPMDGEEADYIEAVCATIFVYIIDIKIYS